MLTKKQKSILDYINEYINKNGYAPTLREIMVHFKLKSVATIHQHIDALKQKGYLKKNGKHHRAIEPNKIDKSDTINIPLVGTISAGQPIEAIENYVGTLSVPRSFVKTSNNLYALKVKGDSMIEEGIFDGDTVIFKKQNIADDGEMVVAVIDDNEATLKKIYKEEHRFRLQPANQNMLPFFRKEVEIRGIVLKIIRNLEKEKKDIKQKENLSLFVENLKEIINFSFKNALNILDKNTFNKWLTIEKNEDKEKFCLETIYTFFNELLLLWICKDKGLLNFESIKNFKNYQSLEKEARNIYSHIFENNIFDWYIANEKNFLIISNFFNEYDFSNVDRDILGKLYEKFISTEERKRLGQFYTPEIIVDYILDQTGYREDIIDKKIIDLSCGSGGFTTRASFRLIELLKKQNFSPSEIIEKVINSIYGLDINPFACYLAETNILIQLLDLILDIKKQNKNYTIPKINIFQTNTIEITNLLNSETKKVNDIKNKLNEFNYGFDFVVGNPPYLEAKKMDRDLKNICIKSCPNITKGAFDLFVCFIDKGLGFLKDGGKFGYIIPNKFLIANYAKKLREKILDRYKIKEIVDVSESEVFKKVSVYPIILIIENTEPSKNSILTIAENIKDVKKLETHTFKKTKINQYLYKRDDFVFFILPNKKTENNLLLKLLSNKLKTLNNYLDIKWTISFHKEGLRDKFIFESKPESKFAKKLIGGKSFAGNSDIKRYKLNWGGWWIDYNEDMAKKDKNSLPPKDIFEQEKIIICQNSLRLRATYDNQKYFCKDTFFIAYLRDGLKNKINLKFLLGLMNSKLLHYYYANIYKGTHVAGGYLHYLIGYLNSLPIAETNKKQEEEIVALVDNILNTDDNKKFKETDHQIDKKIYDLYCLNEEEIKIVEHFV